MHNIKKLFSQVDEYTLIIKKSNTYHMQLNYDLSQHVVHNFSEKATFEIIKDNKKITGSTDIANLEKIINSEVDNFQYLEGNSINEPQVTPIVNHFHRYGELVPLKDIEEIHLEIFNFLQKYKELVSFEINTVISDIHKEIVNNYALDISSNQKIAYSYFSITATGKQKANHYFYINLPASLEEIKAKLKIEIEEKLFLKVNAEDLKSEQYDVMLTSDLSAEIIQELICANSGEKLVFNSFLKDKIGQKIISEKVSILEKPISENYQQYFDMYGHQLKTKYIVKDGILQSHLLSRKNARKLGLEPTGNSFDFGEGCTNIYVESDSKFPDNFTGILIDMFLSIDVDYSSAEVSVSISGFYLKNGKKTGAFRNGVLNINLLELNDIEIFDNLYKDGRIFCGSILFKNIRVNGK